MNGLLGFLLAILILVTVHEFGHFFVARLFKVKVIRFSIGFGKPIWSYWGKYGTEYCIAPIPLGGYVKMLDSRELENGKELSESDKKVAFDFQATWKKILIVFAGPLINLLLPILLFTFINLGKGMVQMPLLGEIQTNSIADNAGLQSNVEVLSVGGNRVETLQEFRLALVEKSLQTKETEITFIDQEGKQNTIILPLAELNNSQKFDLQAIGISAWKPEIKPIISEIIENSAATKFGLQSGDLILSANNQQTKNWGQLVQIIQNNPHKFIPFEINRNGNIFTQNVKIGSRIQDGSIIGLLGAKVAIANEDWQPALKETNHNLFEAFSLAINQTWKITNLIFSSITGMFSTGQNLDQLGGPLTIANQAGESLSLGIKSFFSFLALLSISLALLNLLPIPLLDGGHLMVYFWELISGKPVSPKSLMYLQKIGLLLLMALMIIAFSNDFVRFFS